MHEQIDKMKKEVIDSKISVNEVPETPPDKTRNVA
jgi:hypothetical protein